MGTGIGILVGRRGEERLRRQVAQLRTRTRTSLLPVLERRADALEIPSRERDFELGDPIELALTLGECVMRAEEKQALPFSDTVEFAAGSLSSSKNAATEKESPP